MMPWLIILVVIGVLYFVFKSQDKAGFYIRHLVVGTILFFLITMVFVAAKSGISLDSLDSMGILGRAYFSWLGHFMGNVGQITGNVVKMDWGGEVLTNITNSTR